MTSPVSEDAYFDYQRFFFAWAYSFVWSAHKGMNPGDGHKWALEDAGKVINPNFSQYQDMMLKDLFSILQNTDSYIPVKFNGKDCRVWWDISSKYPLCL